jgi:6-phosphogluconate dehydrogenase
MRLAFVGLGRMGKPMALRLVSQGLEVVGYNRTRSVLQDLEPAGIEAADSPLDAAKRLTPPRVVWLMVASGEPVDEMIWGENGALGGLQARDIIIDGGNSHYTDSVRRAEALRARGIDFLDVGTSGGLEGAAEGACLMIGGPRGAFETCRPIFEALAVPDGFAHVGESGAGHYVKTVHNAIEYAMLQAIGEGFWMLDNSDYELDLAQIAQVWNHGSVIRCWLLELAERAFADRAEFDEISDYIGGGETGEWAIEEARRLHVPTPLIDLAVSERFLSQAGESFARRVVAALRLQFGGHEVRARD